MRFAFVTCVQLGKSCIEKIHELGGKFDLLITLKDEKARNKSGRVYLDEIAIQYDVPLLKINNINDYEVVQQIKEREIDWLFVIGWSQIARCDILNAPRKGCIGMHPTLLPVGRGRAAIPWAIIKGLDKTGVTMFRMDEGVDTGDILGKIEIPLEKDITATQLYSRVNDAHVELIEKYWEDIINDSITCEKQDNYIATEWPERKPEDGRLNHDMSMDEADRLVRAVTRPYPGAFFEENGEKIIVWRAEVSTVQTEMSYRLKDGYLNIKEFTKGE